jgi:tetratricopeptide (TPR) repeat protein
VTAGQGGFTSSAPRAEWPVTSGLLPPLAPGFVRRGRVFGVEGLRAGATAVLAPDPGAAPAPAGTTQLAVYAAGELWRAGAVDLLAWVDASSRAAILAGYLRAAVRLGLDFGDSAEVAAVRVRAWLCSSPRRWLLVLDGLRDPEDMAGLWPSSTAGRLLVTTAAGQVQAAAEDAGALLVPVPAWDQREALTYLSDRLAADREQRTGALDLVSQAGMTEPAALAGAAAVITATGMSCRDYRALFTRRRERLAGGGVDATAAEVTWRLSVGYAESHAGGAGTWPLLLLTAVLEGGPVPAGLLTGPAACQYLARQLCVPRPESAQLRELLLILERCGLVTLVRHAAGPSYVLTGREIAAGTRTAAGADLLADAARTAADALAQGWPGGSQRDWLAAAMRSCATALRRHTGDLLWADGECHSALTAAGHSLEAAGMSDPACAWWQDLAGDAERLAGPLHAHQVTLTLNTAVATAMLAAGDTAGALDRADTVARGCAILHGPQARETLTARIGWGRTLTAAGKPGDAAAVLQEVAADCERLLVGDDLGLIALDEYGTACLASGNTAEAVKALQTILSRREAVASGPGSTRPAAMALYEAAARLAGAYQAAGNAAVAVSLRQQVAAGHDALLGDDHPGTLRAGGALAVAYMAAGRFGEALHLLRQVSARYEQTVGPSHPDTLTALGELAAAYGAAGQLGDAVTVLRDAIARAGRDLSPADPVTLALRGALARMADA